MTNINMPSVGWVKAKGRKPIEAETMGYATLYPSY